MAETDDIVEAVRAGLDKLPIPRRVQPSNRPLAIFRIPVRSAMNVPDAMQRLSEAIDGLNIFSEYMDPTLLPPDDAWRTLVGAFGVRVTVISQYDIGTDRTVSDLCVVLR